MSNIANRPTSALPGTEEKIRVMQERASLGLPIFHPLDATIPVGSQPDEQGPTYYPTPQIPETADDRDIRYKAFLEAFQRQRKNENPQYGAKQSGVA